MKFDAKEKILRLSAEELVLIASAHYGKTVEVSFPERLPSMQEDGDMVKGTVSFALPDFSGEMSIAAWQKCREDGKRVLTLRFAAPQGCGKEAATLMKKNLRALGYALAYGFAENDPPLFRFYLMKENGDFEILEEAPTATVLEAFFARLLEGLFTDASYEIERVTLRLPSFLSVPFPYQEVRDGQKDMMAAVYSAAKQGETLFAMAPTGTGKTMAVLFPALRAMGKGHLQKIFYLTPKNTSARAACEAIQVLSEKGMNLRGVHLSAKERLCRHRAECGDCAGCKNRLKPPSLLYAALRELQDRKAALLTEKDFAEKAKEKGVCPYRLSIACSQYADVIIGDYNYLFDPNVTPKPLFARQEERLFLIDEAHNLPDRARAMYSGGIDSAFFAAAVELYADSSTSHTALLRCEKGFIKTVEFLLSDSVYTAENGISYGFSKTANFPEAFASLLKETLSTLEREKLDPSDAATKEKRGVQRYLGEFLEKLTAYDGHFLTYAQKEGDSLLLRFYCIDPSERVCSRLSLGKAAVFFSATLSPLEYYRAVLCGNMRTRKIEVPSPFESGALCIGVMDKISVRAAAREETLPEIAKIIITAMKERRGNYMVFCPSYAYMEEVAKAFHTLTPKTPMAVQKQHMSSAEREAFLARFSEDGKGYFVGFCVSGGIFSEGIDLVGKRLIGTVVVGVGLPGVSAERELIASYYGDLYGEGREYAYLYPGLNRIMQAAGRVIRTENDRGVVVLIDDRLRDEACRRVFPPTWRHLKYAGDRAALGALLRRFWEDVDRENAT